MSKILENNVEKYLNSLLPARDAVLRDMERYATRFKVPIVGPACARVLFQLARMIGARRVFELGSAIGYSTLWLARAVGPKGKVYYTDNDSLNSHRAKGYLRRAGVLDRVQILTGDALKLLKSTEGEFDLIFNDVNKEQYPEVLRLAGPRLRRGGMLVTDNVLWSGRTAKAAAKGDDETRAIQEFNRKLSRSKDFFTTIVPLRDGLSVAVKEH
ncbi:MAG: O-methyltransferase [Acidobacteriota bacterium]|nr:O-methyltransferase [Acidobacteriota bacterium]